MVVGYALAIGRLVVGAAIPRVMTAYGPELAPPVASIIVPAFNAQAFLAEAVRSALAQTLRRIEVIIVDDASSDGTLPLAWALADEDARVQIIAVAENSGPGAARNRGIAAARGEWIAVLDSDDRYHPDRLRRLIVHAANRGADMVADDLAIIGDDGLVRDAQGLQGQISKAERIDLRWYLGRTQSWGRARDPGFLKPVIRAELLRSLPYVYDEELRVSEDDDLVVRLLLAGARYNLLPDRLYFYRQHQGSITRHLSIDQLEAMVRAGERQLQWFGEQAPFCLPAAKRRVRTRKRALAFERTVSSIKRGKSLSAFWSILRNPGTASMFAAALRKRLPSPAWLAGRREVAG